MLRECFITAVHSAHMRSFKQHSSARRLPATFNTAWWPVKPTVLSPSSKPFLKCNRWGGEAKSKHFFRSRKEMWKKRSVIGEKLISGTRGFFLSFFYLSLSLSFPCRNVDPDSVGVRCVLFDFLRQVMWKGEAKRQRVDPDTANTRGLLWCASTLLVVLESRSAGAYHSRLWPHNTCTFSEDLRRPVVGTVLLLLAHGTCEVWWRPWTRTLMFDFYISVQFTLRAVLRDETPCSQICT